MATISPDGFSWNFHTVPPATPAKRTASVIVDSAELVKRHAAWQKIIDEKLIEWGRDPSQLDDDGVIPPTPDVIRRACDWVHAHRNEQPPTGVVPTGDGGITFELDLEPRFERLEIVAEGRILYSAFDGDNLVTHEWID